MVFSCGSLGGKAGWFLSHRWSRLSKVADLGGEVSRSGCSWRSLEGQRK